ncbi:sensor histidine kinase, partial [Natronomonas sp.]|uniref:sensor histidine kinase n=1 Tax=Natronomonas sp. TaxID=2184060 RepID=UPI00398976BD
RQASHDLRNPLSVAAGRLELAIEAHGDDENLVAVREALADADSRIDEMLEFARLGNAVTDPEPVSLSEAADAAWAVIETDGAAMTLREDVDLQGDADRIERLLENLFRNSVEHGSTGSRAGSDDSVEHGSAAVSVQFGATASGFYVSDDGPGIPESDREHVLESGFTTSADGSGSGLAIVDEIAAAHGWDVLVGESETGGARFEFVTAGDDPE